MIKRETVPGAGTDAQERKGVAVVKDGGGVCCAPSMQPPQRVHIASVMKQCSGYELAVIVMNLLYTLPLTSHHNNKDVYKVATPQA
jgi:hypothetical protein